MRDITFGQYYRADSVIHRLDPRTKLLMVVAYITGVFLVQSMYAYIAVGAFVLLGIILSKVPILSVLKSVKGVLILLTLTSLLNIFYNKDGTILLNLGFTAITTGGLWFALKMALRLILLVIGTALLTLTTTPVDLTDGLESLMKPLKKIKFPVHEVALIMSIALRFIPILMEEVDKIMMAQKARGANFDNGNIIKRAKALLPVLIPLIVSAFRRADELAMAMDARCYNATPNRTKMKVLKYGLSDIFAGLATAIFIALIVAINANFWIIGA